MFFARCARVTPLPDELWRAILVDFDGKELNRVSRTCRVFGALAAAHEDNQYA